MSDSDNEYETFANNQLGSFKPKKGSGWKQIYKIEPGGLPISVKRKPHQRQKSERIAEYQGQPSPPPAYRRDINYYNIERKEAPPVYDEQEYKQGFSFGFKHRSSKASRRRSPKASRRRSPKASRRRSPKSSLRRSPKSSRRRL